MQKENVVKVIIGRVKPDVKISCHAELVSASSTHVVSQRQQQRQAWKTLNQVQGDNPCLIMTHHGFTLIELLVVVLIIGILASVALPQYRIAVAKSRFASLKQLTKSIADAQEIYFVANGTYTNNFDDLAIDMPGGKKTGSQINRYLYDWGECWLYMSDAGFERVWCSNSSVNLAYIIYLQHASPTRSGRRECSVRKTTDTTSYQNTVCKQETQNATPDSAQDADGNAITYIYP